ncbi:hypothetical protein ACWGQ2_08620 [Arthrobacter sp. NPDC055585]
MTELNPERRMHPDELTGVLDPVNLVRYDARWIEPARTWTLLLTSTGRSAGTSTGMNPSTRP